MQSVLFLLFNHVLLIGCNLIFLIWYFVDNFDGVSVFLQLNIPLKVRGISPTTIIKTMVHFYRFHFIFCKIQ